MDDLPPELISVIVSHIASEISVVFRLQTYVSWFPSNYRPHLPSTSLATLQSTLYSCLLLNRRFYALTLPHLYHSVRLHSMTALWNFVLNHPRRQKPSIRLLDIASPDTFASVNDSLIKGLILDEMASLTSITLSTLRVTDESIEFLTRACGPSVREIHLAGCPLLTTTSVDLISQGCAQLRLLDISGLGEWEGSPNAFITPRSLAPLVKGCPLLEDLNLSGCGWVTNDTLLFDIGYFPRLRHLSLAGCIHADLDGVFKLARLVPELEAVNVKGVPFTSGREAGKGLWLKYLAWGGREGRLNYLNLRGCGFEGKVVEEWAGGWECEVVY